ncbi:MAG: hypothetical protein V7637_5851, partial [Mycobacteriales bacterium]
VAITLIAQRAPWWLRRTGVLHIGTTTSVIVMTGNHWILDAVAGLVLAVTVDLAVAGVFRLSRSRAQGGGQAADPTRLAGVTPGAG